MGRNVKNYLDGKINAGGYVKSEALPLWDMVMATRGCSYALYRDRADELLSQAPNTQNGQMILKLLKHADDLADEAIKLFYTEPHGVQFNFSNSPTHTKPVKDVLLAAAIYSGMAWGESQKHIFSDLDSMRVMAAFLTGEGLDQQMHGTSIAEGVLSGSLNQMNELGNPFVSAEKLLSKATDLHLETVELWGISDDDLFAAEENFRGL